MIDRQIVLLAKSLHELDGASLTELEGRITFQKKIYLLQAVGVNLDYDFAWDVYGPYSRGLARDGVQYELNRELADRLAEKVQLSKKGRELFDRACELMERPADGEVRESLWLEILSSIHFRRSQKAGGDDVSPGGPDTVPDAVSRLVERKPHLRDHEPLIDAAWKRVSAYFPAPTPVA